MKKLIFSMAALATMLFASCQQQELPEPVAPSTSVSFTVEVPAGVDTKSIADGNNVDELHYAIYKYDHDGKDPDESAHENAVQNQQSTPLATGKVDKTSDKHFNVTFDLLADQNYVVIFWAQVSGKNHYVLGDLRNVRFAEHEGSTLKALGNAEERAAFFRTYEFDTKEVKDHIVTLYRPFAQLNLGTSKESLQPKQGGEVNGYVIDVQKSEVKVTGLSTSFSTIADLGVEEICGEADEHLKDEFVFTLQDVITTGSITDQGTREYLKVTDKNGVETEYEYVGMNYFFADETTNVTVEYNIQTDRGVVNNTVENVPVKENFRTNIIGNLLTSKTDFEIVVDERFVDGVTGTLNPDENVYVWNGTDVSMPYWNSEKEQYEINDASQLAAFAALVNGTYPSVKATSEAGPILTSKYVLTADIDLANHPWTPIGLNNCFVGIFDGNGKTIRNLNVKTEGNASAGLFASARNVMNVTVKDAVIESHYKTGVIVGDGLCAKIENCHVDGAVITVTPYDTDDANHVGGIVGYLSAEPTAYVQDCSVRNATITGYRDVAAIAGTANGPSAVTGNTAEKVTVTADQSADYSKGGVKVPNAGQIVGRYTDKATISDNTATEVVVNYKGGSVVINQALSAPWENINIELTEDAELKGECYREYGSEETELITINGNGHMLTYKDDYRTYIKMANPDGKMVFNNVKLYRSTTNKDTHYYNNNMSIYCDSEFNNVEFNKGIILTNAGKFTFKESKITKNAVGTYAMFIFAGCDVTIDGCTIDYAKGLNARGIKIVDEDMKDEIPSATLSVSNTVFRTASKAAVLVGSKGGARITWGQGNEISEVKADSFHAVWVDKDYAAYDEKVIVDGCFKMIEASTPAKLEGEVHIKKGTYSFPAANLFGDDVNLICEEGTVFVGASNLNINGATVEGATFANDEGTAVGSTINGTFRNCTFTGKNALRYCYAGEEVVFEDCVFDGITYGVHFDAGSYPATFRRCTFRGFNAFGAALTLLTLEDCIFESTGKSSYNGVNLWGSTNATGCVFKFDGTASSEWISPISAEKQYSFTDCYVEDSEGNRKSILTYIDSDFPVGGKITIDGIEHHKGEGYIYAADGNYYVVAETGLNNAMGKAVANSTIHVPAGEYVMTTYKAGVKLLGTSASEVRIDVKNQKPAVHGGVDIENVTLVFSNENYCGFQHVTAAEKYTNCIIEGQPFLYGTNGTTFDKCTFVQKSSDAYNVWTYGATNVEFNECTFNSAGKSVLIYSEDNNLVSEVTFNTCRFNASVPVDGKAAVEVDASLVKKYVVNLNSCTDNGFAEGSVSKSTLWNVKKGTEKAEVYVNATRMVADGVILYNDGAYGLLSAKGLFWFANEVNANGNKFSGKTVKLAADINLENAAWTPVGQTYGTQFQGTFDGLDHTISNLNVDATADTREYCSSGLFGWLNAATVKNVNVDGATVKGNHNVGVIAGYLETSGCTVENCHVSNAKVECHVANDDANGDKSGAVVGHAGNTGVAVKNCTATECTVSAGRDAGQIVGAAKEANVTGCSATNVTVTANGEGTGANINNAVIGRIL